MAAAVLAAAVMGISGCSGKSSSTGGSQAGGNSADQSTAAGEAVEDGEDSGELENQESSEEGGDQLARIREKGELIVAMEGTWSPWTYHDEDDKLVGYDVEVAGLIAEKLGVKASFVEGEWDDKRCGGNRREAGEIRFLRAIRLHPHGRHRGRSQHGDSVF